MTGDERYVHYKASSDSQIILTSFKNSFLVDCLIFLPFFLLFTRPGFIYISGLLCMFLCCVKAIDGRMEQRLSTGLLTGHAYAITDVRKVRCFTKLYQIYVFVYSCWIPCLETFGSLQVVHL